MNQEKQLIFENIAYLKESNSKLTSSVERFTDMRSSLDKTLSEIRTQITNLNEKWTVCMTKSESDTQSPQILSQISLLQRDLTQLLQAISGISEKVREMVEPIVTKQDEMQLALAEIARSIQANHEEILKKLNEIAENPPAQRNGGRYSF